MIVQVGYCLTFERFYPKRNIPARFCIFWHVTFQNTSSDTVCWGFWGKIYNV